MDEVSEMAILLPLIALLVVGGVGCRVWYKRWKARQISRRRRVEKPNSHYSSDGVRRQEDRERWTRIPVGSLHPLNRDEVHRLLEVVEEDGVKTLSIKERLFLDNMTLPRMG